MLILYDWWLAANAWDEHVILTSFKFIHVQVTLLPQWEMNEGCLGYFIGIHLWAVILQELSSPHLLWESVMSITDKFTWLITLSVIHAFRYQSAFAMYDKASSFAAFITFVPSHDTSVCCTICSISLWTHWRKATSILGCGKHQITAYWRKWFQYGRLGISNFHAWQVNNMPLIVPWFKAWSGFWGSEMTI